ncbi:MAG: DNA polymerase III subunit delta' [Desulfobacteraceae bacterium]|nr:DNA polymerase III subunit delta' [Desulfobacteraceae bacterium]
MPGFESIVDQDNSIRLLKRLLFIGKIPHALLFTGIDGIGKRTCATTFAMASHCEAMAAEKVQGDGYTTVNPPDVPNPGTSYDPCGICRECRRIESGLHPDIVDIKPNGAYIRIDQIRELCNTLSMKPYESGLRFVIISDAQVFTPEAANAILKVLEEPPDRTILILTSQQTSDLLPTIVSRCQQIRFNPISAEHLMELLAQKQDIDPASAKVLAALSGGSYAKALKLIKKKWLLQRDHLLSAIDCSPADGPPHSRMSRLLGISEQLARKKETVDDALELLKTWFRDLAVYPSGRDRIIHSDLLDRVRAATTHTATGPALTKIEAIQTAQHNIGANANVRLSLDMLFLKLGGLL